MNRLIPLVIIAACTLPASASAGLFDRTVELDQSELPASEWTIAQRYHFLQDYRDLLAEGPVTIERRCEVAFWSLSDEGEERPGRFANCANSAAGGEEFESYSRPDRMANSFAALSDHQIPIQVMTAHRLKVRDKVHYSMTIDPAALAVELDMESGPLVEATMVEFEGELLQLDFPPRARRVGVEGKLELLCQIQQDQSLICLPQSFEIPEHFGMFADYFLRQSRHLKMGDRLKDGSPSAGARFPLSVNYRLNP